MGEFTKIGRIALTGLCGLDGATPAADEQTLSTEDSTGFTLGTMGLCEAPGRMHSFGRFSDSANVHQNGQDRTKLIEEAKKVGIEFVSIECPDLSFDKDTGEIRTKDDKGRTVTTFKIEDLPPRQGYEKFRISQDGVLLFEAGGTTFHVQGRMDKEGIVEGGLYMVRPNEDGFYIAVEKENSISFGPHIVFLALNSPITMPHGKLITGSFTVDRYEQPGHFGKSGYLNGEYVAKDGTKFKSYGNYFHLAMSQDPEMECEDCGSNFIATYSDGSMLINTSSIDVEVPDGLYKNVIVRGRNPEGKRVILTIRKTDNTAVKTVFLKDQPVSEGNWKGIKTNIVHLYWKKKHPDYNGCDLGTCPVSAGAGLIPWMIFGGNSLGETPNEMEQSAFSKLVELRKTAVENGNVHNPESNEQIKLLLKAGVIANQDDLIGALGAREGDLEFQFEVLNNSYLYPSIQNQTVWNWNNGRSTTKSIYLRVTDVKSNRMLLNAKLALEKDREALQLKIIEKCKFVTNPMEAMSLAESDAVKKAILEKKFRFKKVSALSPTFEYEPLDKFLAFVYSRPYEEQRRLLSQMDLSSDDSTTYRDIALDEPYTLRLMLETAIEKGSPSVEIILSKLLPIRRIGFDSEKFVKVYRSPAFQERIERLEKSSPYLVSPANKFSIALATVRLMDNYYGSITEQKIADMADIIIRSREALSNRVLFGESVHIIPVFHAENDFSDEAFYKLMTDCGVHSGDPALIRGLKPEYYDYNKEKEALSAKAVKEQMLKTISEGTGRTTIAFNNHGGTRHQWLSDGAVGQCDSLDMHTPRAISYIELGDALMKRGDLKDVTIVFDSCYSYDFSRKLYKYLVDKGADKLPVIITETNKGQLGNHKDELKETSAYSQSSFFMRALEYVHEKGEPITVGQVLASERYSFRNQDMAVFSPLSAELRKELKRKGYKFIEGPSTAEDETLTGIIEVN